MFKAIGLSTHVWNNFIRSALLLAGFPVLLVVLSFGLSMLFSAGSQTVGEGFVAAWQQLPSFVGGAVVVSLIWFAIAWVANQRIIDAVSGARLVSRESDRRLWDLMETLCISRGETMPRLAMIESPGRNAFASGLDRQLGNITVTRGLMEALDDRELSAVLAHELTHIRNGDARLAVIAAVFTGVITLGFDLLHGRIGRGGIAMGGGGTSGSSTPSSSGGSRSKGSPGNNAGAIIIIIGVAIIILAGVLSLALRSALSRNREFLADAGAVQITGDADGMILALRKVAIQPDLPGLPGQVQAMLLEHPQGTKGGSIWATHPPIEDRISALVKFAGGRDPGLVEAAPPVAQADPAEATGTPSPEAPAPGPPWDHALPQPIPGVPPIPGVTLPIPSFSDEVAAMRSKPNPSRPPEA